MSEPKAGARPSQVTVAVGTAVIGSALLVLTLFDSISKLRSVEVRDGVDKFLSSPPGSGLGISVHEALDLLRAGMLFTGAVAAAGVVLAIYVLQRHNAARICFTVAAGLMLLTAPISGGVLPLLVAFSAAMMWSRPARDWFAGRPPTPPRERPEPSRADDDEPSEAKPAWAPDVPPSAVQSPASSPAPPTALLPPSATPPATPSGQAPAPTYGFGTASAPTVQGPEPHPTTRGKRPVNVVIAAALTWIFTGITAAAYLVVLAVLLVSKDTFVAFIEKEPKFQQFDTISTNDLVAALWVVSVVLVFWCLVAMVLAFLVLYGHNWARITLVVSAAMAMVASFAAFPFNVLHLVAAGAVIALLFTGGSNGWFHRAGSTQPDRADRPGPADPPSTVW